MIVVAQGTPTSAARPLSPEDLGPGTTVYNLSHDDMLPLFLDSSTVAIQGARTTSSACAFPSTLKAKVGERPQGEIYAAVNFNNCRALVQRGHLSRLPGQTAKSLAAFKAKKPAGDPCRSGVNAWYQTDAAGIDVNSTSTLLYWCYNYNSNITSCSSSDDYSWYTYTHWYLIWGPGYFSSMPSGGTCKGDTYMEVGNDWFRCPQLANVRTTYWYNEMWGDDLGNYWDNTWKSTSGTCSNLLHWRHAIYAS
jgi:hypothetical protein